MTALPHRLRHSTIPIKRLAVIGLLGVLLSIILALSWPHNYDEGFNYLFYGERGFRFIINDYTYPNNHILFSLIQAMLPRTLIDAEPLALRGPNILISGALLITLTWWVRHTAVAAALTVALVFAGPWSIIYFAVARGYQLGALLVAGAVLVAATRPDERWAPPVTGVLMALATWTVPTFAYGAPVFAALWIRRGAWRDAAVFAGTLGGVAVVAYAPVLDQLLSDRTMSFSEPLAFAEYSRRFILDELFFLSPVASLVVAGLAGWAFVTALVRIDVERNRVALLLLGYPIVFLAVVELTTLVSAISTPFFRNAAFASLFVPIGIWLSPIGGRPLIRVVLVALLAWNTVLGWNLHRGVTDGSEIVAYEGTYIGQTPHLDRVLAGEDVAELRCYWTDEWTCELYRAHFEARGVVLSSVDEITATTCAVGAYPPMMGTGIEVVYRDGATGLVCFD